MKVKLFLLIVCVIVVFLNSMTVVAATSKINDISPYSKNQMVTNIGGAVDATGGSLKSFADGYSPSSRLGWSIVVNGEQSSDKNNWEYGYGQIQGYSSSTGVLSGQGYMFRATIGQLETPKVESLGMVAISIDVPNNKVSLKTGGNITADLGSYSLTKGTGKGVFYGPGSSTMFANPTCILTLANYQSAQNSGAPLPNWNIQSNPAT